MAQTVGLPRFSIRLRTALSSAHLASASAGVLSAASMPISAPATKALVPNPVNTAPLILGSFLISVKIVIQLLEHIARSEH